jgi:hypothetical protein
MRFLKQFSKEYESMGLYAKRLAAMQATADQQMEDYVPGGFSLIAEGEYKARVQAKLGETKAKPEKPSKLLVMWTFTVAEGDKAGRKVIDRNILEGGKDNGKTAKQICRGRMEDLGYVWPEGDLPALETELENLSATPPLVDIRVSHETSKGDDGKEYTNARIRIIDVFEGGPALTAPAVAAEEVPVVEAVAEVKTEADPNLSALLALCGSYQIAYITDDMDVATIVANLQANTAMFKEADLQPEELAMLEAVEPTLIERAAPAPAPVKRAVAPVAAPKPVAAKPAAVAPKVAPRPVAKPVAKK